MPKPQGLLVDANVLIDYVKSDIAVLGLVSQHVGKVHVLSTILEKEVDGLDAVECGRLELRVIEPGLSQLERASARRGALSFHDHLCLIVALEDGLICLTNDKALRKASNDSGVTTRWGLEIMVDLVSQGVLGASDAIAIAEKIHLSNPLHISRLILERFSEGATAASKTGS